VESRQEQENDGCYRLISDLIADYAYAFRVDPSGTITREQMTESLSRITGFTAEELDAHGDYTRLAHPDDLPVLRQRNEKLLSGQRDVSEFRIITKGGETRWLRDQGCPVWDDAQGCVVRIVGAGQDITERVQAENRFQESKRQLESQERFISRIMESIPSSLVVVDPALRIVSVNRNFLGKMRRDEQATLGFRFTQVFPKALLDYTRLDQKIETVFRTGQMMEGGTVAYRAPGLPTRIYYYRLVPLKAEAVNNVMLLMDDITEQEQLRAEVRRIERHLASIVECANDMVVSMDPEGRVVTWNRAAEKASGLEAEHVQHKPLLALCAVEQQPMMAQMLERLARGKDVQATEIDLLTADNRQLPISWSCSSMRNDAHEVIGIVAVGHDLTERRSLEAQLIQSAKMASLGVMAGGIAHELRNPLGIISAGAQLLLERPDDTVLRGEATQKIYAATQRASLIIENLLTFARPQSEHPMTRVNLHAVLEETFALLGHQLTLQTIALHKEFQPDLPPTQGNPHLLQQVFTNLMLNARSAMPGGGMLTVSTCVAQGGQVEVRFRDTGMGIPAENMQQIFDPFFTTMPVGKGIGLGLSISYSIVQQHGGAIQVESRGDQGTTFVVRLPACPR